MFAIFGGGSTPSCSCLFVIIVLLKNKELEFITIPKTSRIERMKENMSIFDFALTESDVLAIAALERNETAFYLHNTPEVVERTHGSFNKTREEFEKSISKRRPLRSNRCVYGIYRRKWQTRKTNSCTFLFFN